MKNINITAEIAIINEHDQAYKYITKDFTAELREGGKIYCPEMIEWVKSNPHRASYDLVTIHYNGKKMLYSI